MIGTELFYQLAPVPTDDEIRDSLGGVDLGRRCPVIMFKNALLSVSLGYWVGSTMQHHLSKFSLIEVRHKGDEIRLMITPLGRDAVLMWFSLKE